MTTHDIALRLVEALRLACPGIQLDYDLKFLEEKFEAVLSNASIEMVRRGD